MEMYSLGINDESIQNIELLHFLEELCNVGLIIHLFDNTEFTVNPTNTVFHVHKFSFNDGKINIIDDERLVREQENQLGAYEIANLVYKIILFQM